MANFIALQKRYIKVFLAVYYRFNDQISFIPGVNSFEKQGLRGAQPWSIRNTAMYLVDSDFDTEDEAYADDLEEVISNHIVNSEASEEIDDEVLELTKDKFADLREKEQDSGAKEEASVDDKNASTKAKLNKKKK